MYLEYYSIKRFFLSFGENLVIFLILTLFVSFGGGEVMVKIHFLNETHFLKGIGGYFEITLPLQPPIKSP